MQLINVPVFAIKVKGEELYLISRHKMFGNSLEKAVKNGVFFIARNRAEARIRKFMKELSGGCGMSCQTYVASGVQYTTADTDGMIGYMKDLPYRPIELEVVELKIVNAVA